MSFNNLIGNNKVKQLLENTIKSNNILHSYLFVGIDGIGKSMFAKEFAKQILCTNREEHCNSCKSCIAFESNNNPDYMEINSEDGNIKIEEIRYMQEKIAEKPITSNKKVYIINDCDNMTKEASNCLLKTLEEPPEYVIIILTTSNESKLLNTIKSRCIKIAFDNIKNEEIEKYMKDTYDINNIENIILMSRGSIGKAIKIKNNQEQYIKIDEIIDNLYKNNIIDVLNNSEVLYKSKEDIQEILDYMIISMYNKKDTKSLNSIKYIEDTKKRLLSNSNYDMCIDNLLIKMWEEINEKYNRC